MGSVIDYRKCPQCGGFLYNEWYYKTGEEFEHCNRCGRWEEIRFPENEDEKKLVDQSGLLKKSATGFGRCLIMFTSGFGHSFSLSEPYSEEIEKWYTETMKDKEVDPEQSYLTRWDEETGKIVVVHGKDPGLYDDFEKGESEECSSAENTDS